jgi:hypothetical protein
MGIAYGKTFHSFRHTFITNLKHKQIDLFIIHELVINMRNIVRVGTTSSILLLYLSIILPPPIAIFHS